MGCLCDLAYCYINIVSSLLQIHEVQIKFKKMVAELFVTNSEFNLISLNSSKLI